jgi:DNA-binding MarR family transcriptional regulator
MVLTTERETRRASDQPEVDLATGLVRLARLVQDLFAQTAANHDLTASQARLLCVLTQGPMTMSELATLLGVEKAAMTGLIDRIERRGLVRRTAVAGDRRACQVDLTPAGAQRAHAAHEDIIGALDLLTCCLSATQQDSLQHAILRITLEGRAA